MERVLHVIYQTKKYMVVFGKKEQMKENVLSDFYVEMQKMEQA